MAMKRFLVLVVLVFASVLAQCAQREETSSLEITDATISCTAGTVLYPGSCCGRTATGPFCVGNPTSATSATNCICCKKQDDKVWWMHFVSCQIGQQKYFSPTSSKACPSSTSPLCEGLFTVCPTCSQ